MMVNILDEPKNISALALVNAVDFIVSGIKKYLLLMMKQSKLELWIGNTLNMRLEVLESVPLIGLEARFLFNNFQTVNTNKV